MGLRGFSLKERAVGQTRSIVEWSSEHFERHRQPLRIAIDQANWWYKNITPEKESQIKRQSPGSHPRERSIMERICYLLRMNVQLIFVFDGPNKPWKSRPRGQNYSASNVALLKELLDQLGVPRHDAPGEAEAECGRLQELGVVDAVWSDDSDTFMFGCKTVVQFHKPEGHDFKSEDSVLVYTADGLLDRSKLSKEGMLMYAILVGCDYADGLPSVGTSTLLEIAKHHKFEEAATILAKSVSNQHRELSKWRAMLLRIVKDAYPSKNFALPPNTFPNPRVLQSCSRPNVSTDSKLGGLVIHWFRPFRPNLFARYRFLLEHFHSRKHPSWPAEYLVPIELNHRLRERHSEFDYGIMEKTPMGPKKEGTVSVNPTLVIPELLDIPLRDPKTGQACEFEEVKAILLDCVIKQGLPNVMEKATQKARRGRPKKVAAGDRNKEFAKLNPECNSPSQDGQSRKRNSNSLVENENYRLLGVSDKLKKGLANALNLDNAAVQNRSILERAPIIILDDEGIENRSLDDGRTNVARKKQKTEIPSLADIAVIDLTEADWRGK
ncbi:PIN domain-like protein [Hypoxylon trugodes]|uniref:PIN domain-like protein n=1 Tax=Hypoxylon trugodes TaxID=326681 RepID=UPI00219D09D6|nr:PIN domain-like protein [Hypoxylon trugodes]KAI1388966.1 PIN domain-like protein [Hypoxylon trugodes]